MLIGEADRRMFQVKLQKGLAADAESRRDDMSWLQ
jgi:hypothetical protein